MRSIIRAEPPPELTDEVKADLTNRYLGNTDVSVWNRPFIRTALAQMCHNKCAYCEARLDEQAMYLEVDHFYPKSRYPLRVAEWTNLLASCKQCNARKGDHDPYVTQIIDPTQHKPSDHLVLYNYRYIGIDELGKASIAVLDLNDYRHVMPRFKIGNQTMETIGQAKLMLDGYARDQTTMARNRVISVVSRLLKECSACSEYSVVVATILVENPIFSSVREQMESYSLWSGSFDQQFHDVLQVACPRPIIPAK